MRQPVEAAYVLRSFGMLLQSACATDSRELRQLSKLSKHQADAHKQLWDYETKNTHPVVKYKN